MYQNSPTVSAMNKLDPTSERVGVVDVGSNSVRMVVFDGTARSPAYFYDEKVMCGLGRGVRNSGVLNPDGKERAWAALRRFKALSELMGLNGLRGVATAAVREASDGPRFCADVVAELGIDLSIISGEQEAHLSSKGVLIGWPMASGLVCDIGGSSMEFATLDCGQIGQAVTSKLGPLALQDMDQTGTELDETIAEILAEAVVDYANDHSTLYLVGGSWRAIAHFHMARTQYPLHVIHDYRPDMAELRRSVDILADDLPSDVVLSDIKLSSARQALVPMAAQVLRQVLERFDFDQITFSSYGLREGLLFEDMAPEQRTQDPLIEACKVQEQANARFPGFGEVLFEWIKPLFQDTRPARMRLIQAACLLHDVTWRAHPDYRAAVCFESATRINMGAVGHTGRVFLAWALMHRYKSAKTPPQLLELQELLPAEDLAQARAVGAAMRLGAMMSGAEVSQMGRLSQSGTVITLTIPKSAERMHGEVVEKRLQSLASAMDQTAEITIG